MENFLSQFDQKILTFEHIVMNLLQDNLFDPNLLNYPKKHQNSLFTKLTLHTQNLENSLLSVQTNSYEKNDVNSVVSQETQEMKKIFADLIKSGQENSQTIQSLMVKVFESFQNNQENQKQINKVKKMKKKITKLKEKNSKLEKEIMEYKYKYNPITERSSLEQNSFLIEQKVETKFQKEIKALKKMLNASKSKESHLNTLLNQSQQKLQRLEDKFDQQKESLNELKQTIEILLRKEDISIQIENPQFSISSKQNYPSLNLKDTQHQHSVFNKNIKNLLETQQNDTNQSIENSYSSQQDENEINDNIKKQPLEVLSEIRAKVELKGERYSHEIQKIQANKDVFKQGSSQYNSNNEMSPSPSNQQIIINNNIQKQIQNKILDDVDKKEELHIIDNFIGSFRNPIKNQENKQDDQDSISETQEVKEDSKNSSYNSLIELNNSDVKNQNEIDEAKFLNDFFNFATSFEKTLIQNEDEVYEVVSSDSDELVVSTRA